MNTPGSSLKISPHSKLVMIGDSITDTGRAESGEATPWTPDLGHGKGYVNLVQALLTATHPAENIRIINRGVSGNTVLDLKNRWQTDVLDLQPDWVSIMIGINDVWRQFDTPQRTETHVSPALYADTYRALLATTRPKLKGLILIAPYVVEPNRADPMRAQMDRYGAVVRQLADEFDAVFVDAQAAIDALTVSIHPTALAWDRIHLNTVGHMALARAFLRALDYRWN